jgi:energy-coupling factor transport system substrate-specific component
MMSRARADLPPLMLTRVAMFVAVGVVAGIALSAVPNVELVTAICFLSGFLLGAGAGLLTGGLTEALFAGFNPMGSSIGLLLPAQVLGMALAGLSGALGARLCGEGRKGARHAIIIVGLGAAVTLVFDLITNLAFCVMAGFSVSQMAIPFIAAVPFAAIHVGSNVLVFALVVAPILPRLERALRIS